MAAMHTLTGLVHVKRNEDADRRPVLFDRLYMVPPEGRSVQNVTGMKLDRPSSVHVSKARAAGALKRCLIGASLLPPEA
eukprot:6203142-Pleurochrysis_carterae.AAC.1